SPRPRRAPPPLPATGTPPPPPTPARAALLARPTGPRSEQGPHVTAPRRARHPRRTAPRTHWLLLSVLPVALSAALVVQGYAQHMYGIGPGGDAGTAVDRGGSGTVPAQVVHGGPVIAGAATSPHTAAVKPRTVALTFDDGPDPVWTPRILDVLRRNHV